MGRRDAVQTMLEVVAECRRLLPGLLVTWEPGWETRGNGTSANYSFGSIHHTASASSAARPFPTQRLLVGGRSDLSGPLANVGTPWCTVEVPRLHVVAAHPANHGGASRASGPVPKLALFNPTSLGNEIDYAGTVPMSAGQLLVGHVWTKAVANVLARGNVEVVRGHYETSVTGKWDPGYASGKSYDMNDWRRISAGISAPAAPPPPAPTGDDDMPQLIDHYVAPGEELTLSLPPSNGGAAGWGRGYLSVLVDRHGEAPDPVAIRIAVMNQAGQYRPAFGTDPVVFIRPGTRPSLALQDGDQGVVLKSLDEKAGVGLLIEYARR